MSVFGICSGADVRVKINRRAVTGVLRKSSASILRFQTKFINFHSLVRKLATRRSSFMGHFYFAFVEYNVIVYYLKE